MKGANNGRRPDGTFGAGNPGKPKGARHKTTLAVQDLLEGQAEGITQAAIDKALAGDTTALRICLDRIAPPKKDAHVSFGLPSISTADEASKAAQAVLTAVSEGEVTPLEGTTIMALVEGFRKTLETADLERRISDLEKKK
ncbi:hypothetical protein N9M66_00415 [Litoreibacter sp.]|nr:hypothetical protein [Litoreibacter sp.]